MTQLMAETNPFLAGFEQFEKELNEDSKAPLHRLRQSAIDRFVELGVPTPDDEEWRFTPIAPLLKTTWRYAGRRLDVSREQVENAVPTDGGARLVLVNGHFAPELSDVQGLPAGVIVGSLAQAPAEQLEPYLARFADYQERAFTALNTAFLRDGALVVIPKGQVFERPIHLVFVATAESGVMAHPRCLVVAGRDSQATLVESYVGVGEDVTFTNAVTEIVLAENAILDHYKLQQESRQAFHIHTLQVQQDRSSNFSSHSISLGGRLVRNDINAFLGGEGCECTLNGLYLVDGNRLVDNHTRIDHAKPHCASHELYKGILDGHGHGVFNGKIYVHPDAQKTDARQTNQTLLLSEDAVINTKPQLEIFADDVKCTHGATVGQLDAGAIFYLRSRGIGKDEARSLLIYAFANDIINRIKVEPLRHRLEQGLLESQHLPREAGT